MFIDAPIPGTVSLIGIDPGTNTLGVGRLDFNPMTMEIVQTVGFTYQAEKMFSYNDFQLQDPNQKRFARLAAHERNLVDTFQQFEPIRITVESNFMSRANPSAYGPLVESVFMIRKAIYTYDPFMSLYLIDPISVKKLIGAPLKKKKGEKDVKGGVLTAMRDLKDVLRISDVEFDSADEHTLDAMAIAYWSFCQLYIEVKGEPFPKSLLCPTSKPKS